MSVEEGTAGLQPHIVALRERASQARRLAKEMTDEMARAGLQQLAEEFERRADELEARLAVSKEASQPAGSIEDIAALKPPRRQPDGEA